jgi:hypothetical protein
MAIITFNDDTHREVPDSAHMTERGIKWTDGELEDEREYLVPWTSVKTFEHLPTEPSVD